MPRKKTNNFFDSERSLQPLVANLPSQTKSHKTGYLGKIFSLPFLPWIICLILLVVAVWGVVQYQKASGIKSELENLKSNPEQILQNETASLVSKVGELVTLPDEQPTVATVTDPSLLKDQPFFAQAQTGDKVLIYALAKKAVIYRPSTNKVIEVAPINLGNDLLGNEPTSGQDAASAPDKSTVAVTVQNAARVSGLAGRLAEKLRAAGYTNVTTADAESAQAETSIATSSQFSALAQDINSLINNQATVKQDAAATGIVIILGSNFQN
jgi:hypothetical protein